MKVFSDIQVSDHATVSECGPDRRYGVLSHSSVFAVRMPEQELLPPRTKVLFGSPINWA